MKMPIAIIAAVITATTATGAFAATQMFDCTACITPIAQKGKKVKDKNIEVKDTTLEAFKAKLLEQKARMIDYECEGKDEVIFGNISFAAGGNTYSEEVFERQKP